MNARLDLVTHRSQSLPGHQIGLEDRYRRGFPDHRLYRHHRCRGHQIECHNLSLAHRSVRLGRSRREAVRGPHRL